MKIKISVLGAGNVAIGTMVCLIHGLQDYCARDMVRFVLCNTRTPEKAVGIGIDLKNMEIGFNRKVDVKGTSNIDDISESNIVVMTMGQGRPALKKGTPGFSRDTLFDVNAPIIVKYCNIIRNLAPCAILLNVVNPLDQLTYVAYKESGFEPQKVIGVGSTLDNARFNTNISAETGLDPGMINSIALGAHGPDMVLPWSQVKIGHEAIDASYFLSEKQKHRIVKRTISGGSYLNSTMGGTMFGIGSAVSRVVFGVLEEANDKYVPCSVYAGGAYGIEPFSMQGRSEYPFIGLPVRLNYSGVKEVVKLNVSNAEVEKLVRAGARISRDLQSYYGAACDQHSQNKRSRGVNAL